MNFGKFTTSKILLTGFLFGAFFLPFIVVLGLSIPYLEYLKPLVAPGRYISENLQKENEIIEPLKVVDMQTGEVKMVQNKKVSTSFLKWIIFGGVNGSLYALIFLVAYTIKRKFVKGRLENNKNRKITVVKTLR